MFTFSNSIWAKSVVVGRRLERTKNKKPKGLDEEVVWDRLSDVPSIPATSFYRPLGDAVHASRVSQQISHGVSRNIKFAGSIGLKTDAVRRYPTQAGALNFIDFYRDEQSVSCTSNRLYLFSAEFDPQNVGRRTYLVATLPAFWRHYTSTPPEKRHFYEVILDRAPCKLYLDIEFQRNLNGDVNGDLCMELIREVIQAELQREFKVSVRPVDFIELDSSTDSKFSRHLILNSGIAVFKDNSHVGAFVQLVVDKLYEYAFSEENRRETADHVFVLDNKGQRKALIDLAVYSKNRNFRLWGCRKIGKRAELRPVTSDGGDDLTAQQLWSSMITTVAQDHPASALLEMDAAALSTPLKSKLSPAVTPKRCPAALQSYTPEDSPFPEIDSYLLEHVRKVTGDSRFTIKSIKLENYGSREGFTLVYTPSYEHRFCFNLRPPRHHAGNHVYFVLHIPAGVFYQKCFDPDCIAQRFSGPKWRLPTELNPVLSEFDMTTPSPPVSTQSAKVSTASSSATFFSATQSVRTSPCTDIDMASLTISSPLSYKLKEVSSDWSDTSLEDLLNRNLI